jgi:K+-sensing histidine kinase KdpD
MIVPLSVGSRVLGAITVVSAESARSYNQADLSLAEELSRRAGIAIDNAELYRAREAAREAAQSAADRTTRLQAVTAALSEAVTPSEVANVVAQAAMAALEARSAFIVAMPDGGAFEPLAALGVDPDFLQAWGSYSKAAPVSILAAIRLGKAVFASRDDFVSRFPALASLPIADRSFAGVPLIVEGRAVGSMVLSFGFEHVLDTEDREFVLALSRLCAQALERARLYDAAADERESAEVGGRQQRFLAEASAILASSLDHETTLSSVAQLCVPDLADWCVIDVRNEDGSFNRVASVHSEVERVELARRMQERYPPDYERGIVSQVVKTGKPLLYTEVPEEVLAKSARDEEHLTFIEELGVKSGIVVPLTARGRTLGILTLLISESERRYGERELKLAEELGQRAGLALDNARLYAAERASRTEAEAAQQRLWFIAEANAVLSSSLDFETTLSRLASLAVPWLADCCVAHVFPGEGVDARAAVSHVDAAKEALVRELHAHYAPRPNEPHPLMEMIQNQAPVLMEDIDEAALGTIIQDDRHREILNELRFKSYMAAPLIARGRLFGAVTFASSKPGRRYSRQDLSLADELARRAALALDNARLYEDSQRIQDALRVALEAKDEFLGVMSHELRTPITAIYGNARVLRSRAERLDEDSKNRMMEDIEQESERLSRMVENLLVLSRLELGQEVATEPVLVQRLVAKLVASFQQRRPSRPLAVNMSDSLDPVAAEPHYLEQILRNLMSNADKYSPPDSPIDVEARTRDGEVEISVLDRGAGIAPEEIDLIFDRFYRSDRTAMQAAGLGMGLTVCKRLAEAQAGRIWARPREGGGLQVGITLPLCKEGMDDI